MFKWLGIIAVSALLIVMGMQLVPVYIQNHAVKKIALEVISDADINKKPKREVMSRVAELFRHNEISTLEPKEIVTATRDNSGEWVLGVKYEERRKLMYNLEIVAAFDDQITN